MPRRCTICDHDSREQIDRALLGPQPIRGIAARFRVAQSSLHRHKANHLAPRVANSLARKEEVDVERLTAWMLGLNEQTILAAARAKEDKDWLAFRGLVAEVRKNVEMIGRLGGILEHGPAVMIDARRQTAVLAGLTEGELRAVAAQAETVEIEASDSRALSRTPDQKRMEAGIAKALPVS